MWKASDTRRDLLGLFWVLMFIYNCNLRFLSSGDCIPARLLPFSILREWDFDLDEFGFLRDSILPAGPAALASLPPIPWREGQGRGEAWLVVTQRATGQLRLFTRGADGMVWDAVWETGAWSRWRAMPGLPIPGTSRPAALVEPTGKIHLFVQASDLTLWENEEAFGQWSGWQQVFGKGLTSRAPVVGIDKEGTLRLVIYGTEHSFYENRQRNHQWQEWVPFVRNKDHLRPLAVANVVGSEGKVWLLASGTQEEPFALPYFVRRTPHHILSLYPVVLPVLISPLYLPALWFLHANGLDFSDPQRRTAAFGLAVVMEKLSASVIAALSALFVYLALREMCERKTALSLTLVYALGTSTWTISSQALWSHGLSELSLSIMVYALLKARQQEQWLLLAGVGAAFATANRPPLLLFSLLALVYVWRFHRLARVRFLLCPVLLSALLLLYNLAYFGSFTGGYGDVLPATTISKGLLSTDIEGVVGLLVSPNRGLLVYTPFAFFSFWGGLSLWLRRSDPLLRYLSLGVIGQIVLYGKYQMWWGGWCFGPRFLTDVAPFLCFFLVPILPRLIKGSLLRSLFVVAVLLSVTVQVTGAFLYTSMNWDASPVSVDVMPERLWDWHDMQILRSLQNGTQGRAIIG